MDIIKKCSDVKQKLEDSGWEDMLDLFIDSIEFQFILNKLVEDVQNDQRFTPRMGDWFNSFIKCKFDDMNVIFLNPDPYPWINIADGMAFSSSINKTEQKTIKYMFDYIETYLDNYSRDPDLTRWAEQGVLLLNASVTTELNKLGSHELLWKPFINYILSAINSKKSNLIVVMFGKKTEVWENLLKNQTIIKVEHPNIASYKGKWDAKNVFNQVNNLLKNQGKTEIFW